MGCLGSCTFVNTVNAPVGNQAGRQEPISAPETKIHPGQVNVLRSQQSSDKLTGLSSVTVLFPQLRRPEPLGIQYGGRWILSDSGVPRSRM